jgi:hypothetical protein
MDTVHDAQDPYAAAKAPLERENPQAWLWHEDGNELAGHLLGSDVGKTRDGDRVPIKLIRTANGQVRSLWLFESPRILRELFAEHDPQAGDYLIIRRYPMRKTQDGERSYWPFAMAVVPAMPPDAEGETVAPPDGAEAPTQTARESERDARDSALNQLHAPLEGDSG